MIRILIVDDQELICEILQTSLESQPDIQVVGRANNGEIAVEKANVLRPDIVLMDINMPVMDGLTATEKLSRSLPEVKVIVFSSDRESLHHDVIKAGAKGYIPKTSKTNEIIEQIRLVYREGLITTSIEPTKILKRIDKVQKELANHVQQVNKKIEQVEQTEATMKKYFNNSAQNNGKYSTNNSQLRSTVEPIIIDLNRINKESKQHASEINQIQNSLEAQISYIHHLNRQAKKDRQNLLIAWGLAGMSLIISIISLLF